jgi:hypothetical protein
MKNNMKELLLINGKYYQLIWYINVLDGIYIYLINKEDYKDIIFGKLLQNDEIELINDKDTLKYVINSMAKEVNTFVI